MAVGTSQRASAAEIIDFDPPTYPVGPSTFAAAGPEQNIVQGGVTIEGGVILGN